MLICLTAKMAKSHLRQMSTTCIHALHPPTQAGCGRATRRGVLRLKDKFSQAHIASFVPICKLCRLRTFRTLRVSVLRTFRTFRTFSIFTLRTSHTSRTFFISALRTSRTFCTLVFLRFVLFVLSVLLASLSVALSAFWSFGTSAVLEGACMTWSPLKEVPLVHTPCCNQVEARRPLAQPRHSQWAR